MDRFGLRASTALNVAMCQHVRRSSPRAGARLGVFTHGIYNRRYLFGMSEAQERAVIEDAFDTVRATRASSSTAGWRRRSPTPSARSHLLAEYGLSIVATSCMTTSRSR